MLAVASEFANKQLHKNRVETFPASMQDLVYLSPALSSATTSVELR